MPPRSDQREKNTTSDPSMPMPTASPLALKLGRFFATSVEEMFDDED
jgi:hypothetical protein